MVTHLRQLSKIPGEEEEEERIAEKRDDRHRASLPPVARRSQISFFLTP
jgi:hypothetical protein